MPYSYSKYKKEVQQLILQHIKPDSVILDVGAGSGSYADLLYPYYSIDGIEIFENYISMFYLETKYKNVIRGNILDYDFDVYDFLIMGDVLEHMTVEDAQWILKKIEENGQSVLVAVPYMFEQGEEYGNKHETHLQPDLTPELMAKRYPHLKLVYGDSNYGYYVNQRFYQSSNK
jgi:cyclopropane fatty-acyl-phospholipid synthase-like methyltransferase